MVMKFEFSNSVFLPDLSVLEVLGETYKLTRIERELMKLLCKFANKTLPRRLALMNIWFNDTNYNARSMDVYISRLRKLLNADSQVTILNVRCKGFVLNVPDMRAVCGED
ncbi:MAG: helix-turn-helix domain-containing protein [Muribaculaceae bacterium]